MIDLHCHTTNSDGAMSPIEILQEATKKRIHLLSITDHDTVKTYDDLKKINMKDYYQGQLMIGVEFKCVFNGCLIEILGYQFDLLTVKEFIQKYQDMYYGEQKLEREFQDVVQKCKEVGIKLSDDLAYSNKGFNIRIIHDDLIKYKENEAIIGKEAFSKTSVFYRKINSDKDFILYVDYNKYFPSAKEVADLIRKAGGLGFLAHLYTYQVEDHNALLDQLVKKNIIDGIEAYYPTFCEEQIKNIESYAKKHYLYLSGGSDYHSSKRFIELGTGSGNLHVKEEEINKWLDKNKLFLL